MSMENRRYDYSPIIRRPKIEWPNHGRIALWVAPNIEYFHYDMPIRGSGSNHTPDVPGYTLRDYGSRVGVFRIMDVLDKFGIRASVLLECRSVRATPANHRGRQQTKMGMARPRHDQQRFHARLSSGGRAWHHSQGQRDHYRKLRAEHPRVGLAPA